MKEETSLSSTSIIQEQIGAYRRLSGMPSGNGDSIPLSYRAQNGAALLLSFYLNSNGRKMLDASTQKI
jgi:hypothetical protein